VKQPLDREVIAMRIAKEIKAGEVVNLGIGMGTLVASYIPPDKGIILHSENGVYGFGGVLYEGQEDLMDYHLTNAGGQFVSPLPGMSFSDMADAFDAAHIGRVTTTVLGAYQVSEKGDLANWTTEPEGYIGSMGGAMDMIRAKRVIISMEHVTRQGEPRIVRQCTYALTGRECVNLIVTGLAVIEVTKQGLRLKEIAPGWTVEEVSAMTEPRLIIDKGLTEIEL
jgi:3-oxoacid CoA-transferase subunit B